MWSKSEAKNLRQQFWTALGQYMLPIPSAEGERINWINYKTGNKAMRLQLKEEKGLIQTVLSVETTDDELKTSIWETLVQHRYALAPVETNPWDWNEQQHSITCSLPGIHILQQDHWPPAISFFKQSLMGADGWWCGVKYSLANTQVDF